MYLRYFIALCALFTGFQASSQECNYTLSGKVMDFHDKTPLAGATLYIAKMGTYAYTDLNGAYSFEKLCAGTFEIEVMHPECRTLIFPINIPETKKEDFLLEHHLEELDEVRVIGSIYSGKTNSGLENRLSEEALLQNSGNSLGDAIKGLRGVSSLNTGSNIVKPAIHGLNGSRVLVLNDGVRMQDMEWGDEHAPNVDVNAAGSVTVIKGASALQYGGDAIGGVILMEQAYLPAQDTLYGKTVLNGFSNGRGGNISTDLTKIFQDDWFIRLQGSFKRLGDQESPDYILSNTGISETASSLEFGKRTLNWGIQGRYSYYDAEIAILRASHIGNIDDLIRSINSGEPQIIRPFTYDLQNPRQDVRHHLAKISAYKRFQGLGKWSAQYDFQQNRRKEYDVRRGELNDQASLDLELTTHSVSTDFKWDAAEKIEVHTGLVGRYQENFPNPATGVRRLIPDYKRWELGAFVTGEYNLTANWSLDAGFRYDFSKIDALKYYQTTRWEERGYEDEFSDIIVEEVGSQLLTNPVFTFENFSGTTGIHYSRDNSTFLRFNYSLSQRAPNPSELFSDGLHHSAARIELGDLRIKSETSHKFSGSFERRLQKWGFTLEPYANFLTDFILLEPTGLEFTIRGAFPVWSYRQTNARLLGFDASAYVNWHTNWRTEHQMSLVKGKDMSQDQALINMPPVSFRNQVDFLKKEWHDFEVSFISDLVLRQNEVPPNITVFSPEQQQDVLLEINTPPPAYHLVGLSSSLDFSLGTSGRLTTSLIVNNLLNTTFRDYLNRQRFFADGMGRNIQLQIIVHY